MASALHSSAPKVISNKPPGEDIKKASKNTSIKKGYIDGELEQVDYEYYEKVEPGGIAVFGELNQEQIDTLLKSYKDIIHSHIPTIEKYGGGSARCMLTELF